MKESREPIRRLSMAEAERLVVAPLNEELAPRQRFDSSIRISELTARIATHIICHAIVDYADLLATERLSVASAFLQRVTSTHLCNHKLTKEGIVYRYEGQSFRLHEEFKTMTLTRSAYEHLAMFYFLYQRPHNDEERSVVWNYWKINSKKSLLTSLSDQEQPQDSDADEALKEIEQLRNEIFATRVGQQCRQKLEEWTNMSTQTQNGIIEFYRYRGHQDVRRISYSQAWKYLFDDKDMTLLYRHLSIHSHPIYNGLLQYQDQAQNDEGYDGIPLYLSSCFLSRLCRLFLRLIPDGDRLLRQAFTRPELLVFQKL